MQGRSLGLCLLALGALLPPACAPGSEVTAPGAQTGGGGAGGTGGSVEAGTCPDPSDADGDFVTDALELGPDTDTDGDGTPDDLDTDSDGDGIADADEAHNARLDSSQPGRVRDEPCDDLADSDGDGDPDLRDLDSDNDGVLDADEHGYDPNGDLGCVVLPDCDGDGVVDVVEAAAGTDPTDPSSVPADPGLYFVLPYQGGEQTRDFTFSTGIAKADIYFLVDTTASMQPAIDALVASLDTKVIPTILNGDLTANPPIPAITDAWMGVGAVRDVPWGGYGQPGDDIYEHRFTVGASTVVGDVQAPVKVGNTYKAPDNVGAILGSLVAAQGGDGPEGTTQALWIAAANKPYAATIGGIWSPAPPYPATCADPTRFSVPCFRQGSIPIFVVITDAPFHNGPQLVDAYDPSVVGGTKSYAETVAALAAIDAKVVGVPVAGANPGAARADLTDLATQTGSLWFDPAFGGSDKPLVPQTDVATGEVSDEVVRLLGLLAGAGLHDVTTSRDNYDCPGGVDCTGDGVDDLEYHNATISPDTQPFDASTLITKITPVPSNATPLPYGSLDETTFYDVRGDAEVTFRVHAQNDVLAPPAMLVLRALVHVQTPAGQGLGGVDGVKLVYLVIPPYVAVAK